LGVNLAGIDIILNMRRRMRQMQEEMQAFVDYVQKEFCSRSEKDPEGIQNALVRIERGANRARQEGIRGKG